MFSKRIKKMPRQCKQQRISDVIEFFKSILELKQV